MSLAGDHSSFVTIVDALLMALLRFYLAVVKKGRLSKECKPLARQIGLCPHTIFLIARQVTLPGELHPRNGALREGGYSPSGPLGWQSILCAAQELPFQ